MKSSRIYIVSVCALSLFFISFLSSCKSASNWGENQSSVSSLTINTPSDLNGIAKSVRVFAVSEKKTDTTCKDIRYPDKGESNFDNAGDFIALNEVEKSIKLQFLTACFPYKVSLAYMCPSKAKKDENVICYSGEAEAKLEYQDGKALDTLLLKVPLTAKNGYTKNVKDDRVVSDFIAKECVVGSVLRGSTNSIYSVLLNGCDFDKAIQDVTGFEKEKSDGGDIDYVFSDTDYKFQIGQSIGSLSPEKLSVITDIKLDKGETLNDLSLKHLDFLIKPVVDELSINYCEIEDKYTEKDAGCKNMYRVTWTKKK